MKNHTQIHSITAHLPLKVAKYNEGKTRLTALFQHFSTNIVQYKVKV